MQVDAHIEFNHFPLSSNESGILRLRRFSVSEDLSDLEKVVLLRGRIFRNLREVDLEDEEESFEIQDDSTVSLGLSPYGSNGFISMTNRTIFLSTPWISEEEAPRDIYASKLNAIADSYFGKTWRKNKHEFASVIFDASFLTGVADIPLKLDFILPPTLKSTSQQQHQQQNSNQFKKMRKAYTIAAETDYEMYKRKGNNGDAVVSFYFQLLGSTSSIYVRDFGAELTNTHLAVWTVPDPYPNTASGALDYMKNTWDPNTPKRALAALVSAKDLGGGVAYFKVLCNTNYAYAINGNMVGSFPIPVVDYNANNWDLIVYAHEVGHVFGASHTHDLNPPADNCGNGDCSSPRGGTIMSYCHTCSGGISNIQMNFHERTESEVKAFISGVSC